MSDALERAIDYIERHLGNPLRLADISAAANLSSFHFSRLFRSRTGMSPMAYVRARRLSLAAASLCHEQDLPITELALAHGFESHQGFTTAFKRRFAVPPSDYRQHPTPQRLQERLAMSASNTGYIPDGPDFRQRDRVLVAGLALDCDQQSKVNIPQLWVRFAPRIGTITARIGSATYGVCAPLPDAPEGTFRYIAAVEVREGKELPEDLTRCELPAGRHAVFTHRGSLDNLHESFAYIFGQWLETSGTKLSGTPDFEYYDERFDPITGTGAMEIWVPVQ